MAIATHSRPTYTDRNRLWGVGIADPEDLRPSHFTWHSGKNRRQPTGVSDISAMLALRYADERRGGRVGAWRLSIGSSVAKCKSGLRRGAPGWAGDYRWRMRHRFAAAVLGLALGARPAAAQAPLTPLDSAVLNSQPLKRLVLAPSL